MPQLKQIIDIIESVAPRSAQEQWDNSGMQIGRTGREIKSILLTTDVNTEVVNEAILLDCQLIISHHPLLFHGIKQICGQNEQARVVELAIKNNIAIYSAHTSLDSVIHGISGRLADILGITNYRILIPSANSTQMGLGVIGQLEQPMTYDAFLLRVKERLNTQYIRYTDPKQEEIHTVALCGGSGAEFIEEAISQGADVYITADCKYHEMQAADKRIGLIDIDHWISECHCRKIWDEIADSMGVTCYISQKDKSPIKVLY